MYPKDYRDNDIGDEYPKGYGWPSADVPPWNSHAPIKKQTNKHMGDMADYTLEQMNWDVEDSYAGDDRPQTLQGYWRQKDGTFIEIKKMTDDHIKNSIALCERKHCSFLAADLVCEQIRREKILDIYRQKRDPVYAAFCAGWNAGHKSAYNETCPDVGPGGFAITKETAWTQYKINK